MLALESALIVVGGEVGVDGPGEECHSVEADVGVILTFRHGGGTGVGIVVASAAS